MTLAALHDGDTLSFTRLQDLIGLTPGNLITHLRKLEDVGYVRTEKTGGGATARTSVALTRRPSRSGALHNHPTRPARLRWPPLTRTRYRAEAELPLHTSLNLHGQLSETRQAAVSP